MERTLPVFIPVAQKEPFKEEMLAAPSNPDMLSKMKRYQQHRKKVKYYHQPGDLHEIVTNKNQHFSQDHAVSSSLNTLKSSGKTGGSRRGLMANRADTLGPSEDLRPRNPRVLNWN